jgi:hypothetical protein
MAGVKFMVMYPRPQDTDTFEHLYQDEDVPIGLSSEYFGTFVAFEKLYQEEHGRLLLLGAVPCGTGQDAIRSDQGRGDLEWDAATVLPYRRGAFPVAPDAAGVRTVRRWQGDPGPCRQDLQWRSATFSCRGRDHAPFWHRISMGPAERVRVHHTPASAVLARRSAIETHCFP